MKQQIIYNRPLSQRSLLLLLILLSIAFHFQVLAGVLTISDGGSHDIEDSNDITFSGSGGTLNCPFSSFANTSSNTLTVASDITAVITGTQDDNMGMITDYDFSISSTTLEAGSSSITSLTVMNPGTNDLGDLTAGDKTSLTITDDSANWTTVGQVTIDSLTLNNNAANGFTINNNVSSQTLDLGSINVTTGGKLIINSTGSSSMVTATTPTAIDLDVLGTGYYASTGTATKTTSNLGTVNLAADSAGTGMGDFNFSVSLGTTNINSLNITDNKHATISVGYEAELAATSTTVGTGTSDTEGDAANTSLFITINSGFSTPGICSLGTLSLGNSTITIDDEDGTPVATTITASTLTLTGASMLNGNDAGVVHILKLTADTFTPDGHTLYYNGDRVKLVQNNGSEISSANLVNTASADPKITSTTTISTDKEYLGIELATDDGATVTVNGSSTAGIVGSTILNNNTLTVEAGSTYNQLNDNTTNEADFSGTNGTVNLGGTLTLSNTNTTGGSNKIGTLNTTSATAQITGNPLELTDINIENSEDLTLKNTTTISTSGTVNNAGTLTLDGSTLNTSSTSINLGTIASGIADSTINVTAGTTSATATSAAKTDVNISADATLSTTATSSLDKTTLKGSGSSNTGTLNIAAGTTTLKDLVADGHGTVSVTKDASLSVTTGTTVGTGTVDNKSNIGDNTLTISADHTSSGSVNLGAIVMGNGTLIIDDSNGTATSTTISGTTLTLTGASMLNGNDTDVVHILKLTGDTFTPDSHNLYYNSSKVSLVDNSSSAITSANLIDTAEAADEITTTTNISSNEEYKGVDLTSGSGSTVTISNNSTAGIVGDTTLNNNTLTIESGSTFNQLSDNDTNKADLNAGEGTVNLGGTLTLANTNTTSGSNKIDTLNTTGSSAQITGTNKELTVRKLAIDSGEGLTIKNILNFETNGTVSNSGTLTLDGGTINSSAGSLNLGTLASGTGDGKINVNAGTTTATATSAAKVDIDISTAATFKTAATSSLDTITLKGSTDSNTAHLDVAAGTTTLDKLVTDGHGTVTITKNASLDVTTGTTVGTGTAADQDSASNNSLKIQEDNTSSGSVNLGALTLGNGTLILDDTNTSADVLTISADSLTLTGASMLNGADAGVIHKLKIADSTLTDNSKYLYYNSKRVQLVGSDGTTAITSTALKDISDVKSIITSAVTITEDSEYAGINFSADNYEEIKLSNNSTVGIFGDTNISGSMARLYIEQGSTLNQLNDTTTNTADFNYTSEHSIALNGTLNLANTNSSGNSNYISKLATWRSVSSEDDIPTLIADNVTIGLLGTVNNSMIRIQGKATVNELYFSSNNSNYEDNIDSCSIVLNGGDLTLNEYSNSYPDVKIKAINSGNKLTNYTKTYYPYLEVKNGDLDLISTTAKQYIGYGIDNIPGELYVTADTCDSTLSTHDSHGTLNLDYVNLKGTYDNKDTPADSSDDTGYHAILDISGNSLDEAKSTYIKVESSKSGKLITDQSSDNTSRITIENSGTLYIPRNSTSVLEIPTYTSTGGTLDISSDTNTVKSALEMLFWESPSGTTNQLIADGDGSGGKDSITISSFLLYGSLLYDSSKVELLDSNNTQIVNSNLIDTYNAQNTTAGAGENIDITDNKAVNNLNLSASGASTTIEADKTLAVTGTTSLGSNTLNVGAGSTFVATGTVDGSSGTVNLGNNSTLRLNTTTNNINTINATDRSAILAGGGTARVDNLNLSAATTFTVSGGSTIELTNQGTASSTIGGTFELSGNDAQVIVNPGTYNFTNFYTKGYSLGLSEDIHTLSDPIDITLITGTSDQSIVHLNISGKADFDGHTEVRAVTVDATSSSNTGGSWINNTDGTYAIGINRMTLSLIDSTFIIGNRNYITGINDDVNDSHIEVLGSAAGNTSTIDNRSVLEENELYLLDVISGSTAGYTATLDIDNTESKDSKFKLGTINVTGDVTGGAATLNFKATGNTNTVVQDIDLTTLNINGVDATGTATVTSQHHTDLSVDTVNFLGTTGVFDNQVAYAATDATTAKLGAVTLGTTDGDTTTGTLKSTVSDAKTTITDATITGGTSTATLNITGDDADDTFEITTLNLAGADAVTDAVLTVNNNSTVNLATTTLASGTFGTINNNANTTFTHGTIDGELKISGSTLNLNNGTFTIGSSGKLDVSANNMTVDNSDKLIFNLGTTSDTTDNVVDTAGKYATSTGNITATRTGTAIENVYGKNGVAGETYLDVVTFAGGVGAVADDTLQTDDYLRTYTLKDQDGHGDAFDILVETNSTGISSTISGAGGSAQDTTDVEELVNKQATADSGGRAYINQVLDMSPTSQITAMEEKRGQDATTATTQASIQTIAAASGAVSNQLTAFRSGNLSAGMSSSFGSSGSTAALSDMADAEALEDAYSSVGYTAASADDIGKYQVWANGFGGFGEQGSTDDSRGYDFHNVGTMVGIDYRLADELRFGGLLGYSYNVTEIYANAGESKDNALRLGAYASYNWNNLFVDLTPTLGIHFIESQRNLNTGKTATGKRTAIDFNINSTIGYTITMQNGLMLTPSFSLGYTIFNDPEYTETGAGVQNNQFDSFTSNSLLQDIGIKAGKLFRHNDKLSFLPEVWTGWEVEYLNTGGDRNSTTSSSLFSNTYSSSMNGMATHRAYWGAGVTALINDNISIFGRYDHKIWDKGYNVGFSAGIKVAF